MKRLSLLTLTYCFFQLVMVHAQKIDPSFRKNFNKSLASYADNSSLNDSHKEKKLTEKQWILEAEEVIYPGHRIYSIKMVDTNVIWMVSTFDAFPPPQDADPYVLKSIDGGTTWEQFTIPGNTGHYAFDIAPIDDQIAYVLINDEAYDDEEFADFLYKTTDGGNTWNIVENYPYSPTFIHFFNKNEGWVLGADTTSNYITHSMTKDGGTTWTHTGGTDWVQPEGTSLPRLDTTEFLGTWTFSVNSHYSIYDSIILFGGTKKYWISHDKGYNWNAFESPLLKDSMAVTVTTIKNDSTFMLASNVTINGNYNTPVCYTTQDAGTTWTKGQPLGNLSAIQYLPNTEQSFISIGHYDFGGGSRGTYRTDDLVNWTKVDNVPLIAMDFVDENNGVAVLGYIASLGENGDVYKWDKRLQYQAEVNRLNYGYSIVKEKHFYGFNLDYQISNLGLSSLENITAIFTVTMEGDTINQQEETLEIASDAQGFVLFDYAPEKIGIYEWTLQITQENLGDGYFFEDSGTWELSNTTMAKDDGTPEVANGFGSINPEWYGYFGNEFELEKRDTLNAISIVVSPFSDSTGTFNLTVVKINSDGSVSPTPIYNSGPIAVTEALQERFYTHFLYETPLALDAGRYIFAAGQDTIQGNVSFGIDYNTINDGYWEMSPVAWEGYPWGDYGYTFTLMIRPHFGLTEITTSVSETTNLGQIQVFPSPFRDKVNIIIDNSPQNTYLQLFDNNGRLLKNQVDYNNQFELDGMNSLPKGLYILKITTNQAQETLKLIKQ